MMRSEVNQQTNTNEQLFSKEKKSRRGFAAMNPEQIRKIASMGGQAISKNREHMEVIGKKGGDKVSRNREHMAEIGRKGGQASRKYLLSVQHEA